MNKSASLSPLDRRLALAALCVLALSGVGLLASNLLWNSHGLKMWLLPLGPWSCALLVYRLLRRRTPNETMLNTEKKRQTTLRVTYSKIPEWQRCLQKMQDCKTLDALVVLHGPPHHKVQRDGFEVWHYPLGVEAGMFYSIHVSVWPDQSRQALLYFEPTSIRRRWWQFWKRKYGRAAQPSGRT
jgi:hypothetical protein